MSSRFRLIVVLISFAALIGPTASAQSGSGDWQFAIAPYLWASGMDGTMAIGETELDIDYPFSDVISDLDFALMGHFDMRNEHWMVSSDLVYVDLGRTDDVDPIEPGDPITAKSGMDMVLFEVSGGYRISPVFTLLVGGRWVDMEADIALTGGLEDHHAEASKSWLDPLVGVHAFVPLSEKWWLGLRGDVGGFGVGSELTWQAYADIGWQVSDLVAIILGYHAIDIDYESGNGFETANLDVMISGPQLGVAFRF